MSSRGRYRRHSPQFKLQLCNAFYETWVRKQAEPKLAA
jgi:hypothetical protein